MKARRFFRIYADKCYGYLAKRKERTPREQEVVDARHKYLSGIIDAWNIYTKNNELVKKAKKVLDVTIHEAYKLTIDEDERDFSNEEYASGCRLYAKATRKAYEDFAEAVNDIWEDFTKDMERL